MSSDAGGQTADGPTADRGVANEGPRSSRGVVIAAVVVVVALLGGLTAVLLTRGGDADSVTLEPAAADGPDPFTATVATTEVASFPETVTARTAEVTASLSEDDSTGTLTATGTTPGLYGGTRDDSSCDPEALAAFLAEDEAKAAAWAGVFDLDVDDIPSYLASLTPVVLTVDTLVTNHGFANGVATPRQSVLQAGTAVMVDDEGTPRVRCSCGNPLAPAASTSLSDATVEGEEWSGYEPAAVTTVRSGEPVTALTLTDLRTGEPFEQPVGVAAGGTWIAVSSEYSPTGTGYTGMIHTSPDGVDWSVALDTTPMLGVATSDDLAVVVGTDGVSSGVVLTSTDGATWSPPTTVVDPLTAVAHGDGVWTAVGNRSFAEEGGEGDGSAGAIYRSEDGVAWTRVATTSPYDNTSLTAGNESGFLSQTMLSVGHGDGLWVATAQECAERACQVVEFTSPDGIEWTRLLLDGSLTSVDVAHDGTRWGLVGAEADTSGQDENGMTAGMGGPPPWSGVAGTSTDGTTWSFGPTSPDEVVLAGLSASSSGWLAVDDGVVMDAMAPVTDGVWRSSDLQTWERLSTIDEDLHGVAILAGVHTAPAAPTTSTTTTAAPAVTTSSAGVQILTRGLQFQDADGMNTELVLYTQPASTAVGILTAMLGAPTSTQEAGDGTCVAASTVASWGALKLVVPGTDPDAMDWTVVLTGTPAELPAAPVVVAGGFTLGTTSDELANYYPGVPKLRDAFEGSTYDSFLLDPSGGEGDPGVLVFAKDGVTTSISAPSYLSDDC